MDKKSKFLIELENEAKVKEKLDQEQIKELNRAMIQGLDLNKAAKEIYGTGKDPNGSNHMKLKSNDKINFEQNWRE